MKTVTWIPALLILMAMGSIGIVACNDHGPPEQTGGQIEDPAESASVSASKDLESVEEEYASRQKDYEDWHDDHKD